MALNEFHCLTRSIIRTRLYVNEKTRKRRKIRRRRRRRRRRNRTGKEENGEETTVRDEVVGVYVYMYIRKKRS